MKRFIAVLVLFSFVLCAGVPSQRETIIVNRPDGEAITSFSAQQHDEQQDLTCHLRSGATAKWSILPSSRVVRMTSNGTITVSTTSLLPKTVFTITAIAEEEKSTLEFAIEVHGCEYGDFMDTTIEGGGVLELYRDSVLVVNETMKRKYYCLPVATYQYRVIKFNKQGSSFFRVSNTNGTRFHTGFIAREVGEGSFSTDPSQIPSLHFPSIISILPNSRKRMFLSVQGPVDRVEFSPTLQFDLFTFTFTLNAPEEPITTYTITAFYGEASVNSTFTVFTASCPEGYSRIVVAPQYTVNQYSLPEVDSPLFYIDEQSFCINADSFTVSFITSTSSVLLYFLEDGQVFFHYSYPADSSNAAFSFTVTRQKPVAFTSPVAFSTDAPNSHWAEVGFDEKGWKKGAEGSWGAFASSAWFRAPFTMDQDYSYCFLLLRGEGSVSVFVNGNAFSSAALTEQGASIVIPASFLTRENVIAVALVDAVDAVNPVNPVNLINPVNSMRRAKTLHFGLSVRLTNSPHMHVMDGEASAVQPNPDASHPPQDGFFVGNAMNHYWSADAAPAELIFSFHNGTQQVVNEVRIARGPAAPFALQIVGVSGEERVTLAAFNRDSIGEKSTYLSFANLRAFAAYHLLFTAANLTQPLRIHSVMLFSRPLYACPKKYGARNVLDGTTLFKRCPLGFTGRKQVSCVRENGSTHWTESREQCFATNPAKDYEFLDWSFTVRGMTSEAWQEGRRMTEMLAEETYMRGRDIAYLYADYAVDGETTVLTVFSRCLLEKGLGAVIRRNLERLEPRFSELVAKWTGVECTASIDSMVVRHHVNWAAVISVSAVSVVVLVVVAVYLSFRNKKGEVKHLQKRINANGDDRASLLV